MYYSRLALIINYSLQTFNLRLIIIFIVFNNHNLCNVMYNYVISAYLVNPRCALTVVVSCVSLL